ncbi:hypothetical protein [Nocardioides sp. W7]|uniref:hypothetical protein n=1 Tax=Nocardioides sp. W7 TaxID=2931390 RepID=UPI001FD02F06|nr:hypothetical protein [Nocardioides sp. W7]
MARIEQQIARMSEGRVRFDPHRRRLAVVAEDGAVQAQATVREVQLRNRLQRLLLNAPNAGAGEPEEISIRLLLTQVEGVTSAPAPSEALQRLVS